MPHKADASFFDSKRPWSERKDLVLGYYLKPYLAKVATLRRPIIIVDGFAGPGKFGDGKPGSPLIIASQVQERLVNSPVPIKLVCIEEDDELYARLHSLLKQFEFADARHGRFLNQLPQLEIEALGHTIFLYVDPYAIEGLEWESMDRVFAHVQNSRTSVEVLLNFSASSFARRGLAAMGMVAPRGIEDELDDPPPLQPPSVQRLNNVVGGDWWQEALRTSTEFPAQVQSISSGFCQRLRKRFAEVCEHPVKEKWHHKVPKYSLLFGSRSADALILMNEAMIKSRDLLAHDARPAYDTLFETRPHDLVPDLQRLPELVLSAAANPISRGALIAAVVRRAFCQFSEKQIKHAIDDLLKSKTLNSETGKTRINDQVKVWRIR